MNNVLKYLIYQILLQKMETYKRSEELIYEHKKTLCNTNMNHFFLFLHTLSRYIHQQRTMKPFSIIIMKVQLASILSSSLFNVTYIILAQENFLNHIQSNIIVFLIYQGNDPQSPFILIWIPFLPYHTKSICFPWK